MYRFHPPMTSSKVCGRFRRSWRMRVGGYTSLEEGKGKLKYYLMGSRSTIPRAGTLLPKLMSML